MIVHPTAVPWEGCRVATDDERTEAPWIDPGPSDKAARSPADVLPGVAASMTGADCGASLGDTPAGQPCPSCGGPRPNTTVTREVVDETTSVNPIGIQIDDHPMPAVAATAVHTAVPHGAAATPTRLRRLTSPGEHRIELIREATVMILYVSVVEIAELAALPEAHYVHGRVTGPTGGYMLAIVWGTAIGLALAHWFAFRVAAPGFRGERPTHVDVQIGVAQVAGAALVALVSSLPVLLFSDVTAQETIGDVPAVLVGAVGYLVARRTGSGHLASAFYGLTALALGVVVALVKTKLSAH
jgi:hypothetical protein